MNSNIIMSIPGRKKYKHLNKKMKIGFADSFIVMHAEVLEFVTCARFYSSTECFSEGRCTF